MLLATSTRRSYNVMRVSSADRKALSVLCFGVRSGFSSVDCTLPRLPRMSANENDFELSSFLVSVRTSEKDSLALFLVLLMSSIMLSMLAKSMRLRSTSTNSSCLPTSRVWLRAVSIIFFTSTVMLRISCTNDGNTRICSSTARMLGMTSSTHGRISASSNTSSTRPLNSSTLGMRLTVVFRNTTSSRISVVFSANRAFRTALMGTSARALAGTNLRSSEMVYRSLSVVEMVFAWTMSLRTVSSACRLYTVMVVLGSAPKRAANTSRLSMSWVRCGLFSTPTIGDAGSMSCAIEAVPAPPFAVVDNCDDDG
mmetsp:Transcript_41214/g.84157  ORF Transcript_41214/g.84157 Transcript_41214/m.84157 type:complete len:311 (+) Transcript_41214:757-1689(+)